MTTASSNYFIFVVMQHDGNYIVGTATNPALRIAAINSGLNPRVRQRQTIKQVIEIKPISSNAIINITEQLTQDGKKVLVV
jgi:predicted GIY-YIG superfamily endonuclease